MRLVIKPHRPFRTVCLYFLLLLFVSVIVLYASDYGFWRSVSNAISSSEGFKELLTEVRDLTNLEKTIIQNWCAYKARLLYSRES